MTRRKASSKQKAKSPVIISIFLSLLMLAGMLALYSTFSDSWVLEMGANVLRTKPIAPLKKNVKKYQKRVLTQTSRFQEIEQIAQRAINCYAPEIENPVYQGEFITKEVAVSALEDDEFTVNLYIKNTGNASWFGDSGDCYPKVRLGTAKDRDRYSEFAYLTNEKSTGWLQGNRIVMAEFRVDPGEIATFSFTSRTPYETDTFREYFQPVVEGKQWMERKEETARVDIAVGYADPRDSERLKYLNKTARASTIDPDAQKELHIDISDQKAHLKIGETPVREYTVSTGKRQTPTPTGKFKILNKQELRIANKYPHYRMPKWQSVTKSGVGLHALPYLANDKGIFWNEALNHIGRPVSHGCIRFLPDDADDLYNLTAVGDLVNITW